MNTIGTAEFVFVYAVGVVFYFLTVAAIYNDNWEKADQETRTSITRAYASSFVWPIMLVVFLLYPIFKLFQNLGGAFRETRKGLATLWKNLDLIGLVRKGAK